MLHISAYKCEFCNFTSQDQKTVYLHELGHLGLSEDEAKEYNFLILDARANSHIVRITKNSENEKSLDKAIKALCEFEERHPLSETAKAYFNKF